MYCLPNNFLFYCIPLFMIILLNIDTNGVKKSKTTFEANHGCTIRFEFIEWCHFQLDIQWNNITRSSNGWEHCNLKLIVVGLTLDMPHFYLLCLDGKCVVYIISLKINETSKLMHFTTMCQISEINNEQNVLRATLINIYIFLKYEFT